MINQIYTYGQLCEQHAWDRLIRKHRTVHYQRCGTSLDMVRVFPRKNIMDHQRAFMQQLVWISCVKVDIILGSLGWRK